MEGLSKANPQYVVVRVNIDHWDSPVCKQFTQIHGIPFLQIYGPDRALKSEGQPARQEIEGLLPQN